MCYYGVIVILNWLTYFRCWSVLGNTRGNGQKISCCMDVSHGDLSVQCQYHKYAYILGRVYEIINA